MTRGRFDGVGATVLGFAVAVGGCGGEPGSARPNAEQPYVASEACRLKTPGAWQTFLASSVADEKWVQTCSDLQNCDASVGSFRAHVMAEILPVFDECATDLVENPAIERCTARLRRYVPAWLRQHVDDSYGFRQDNATYLATHTGPNVPAGMMEPPLAFLAALPERATLEKAARDNGWPYLTHDSCLGGVRTFVTVSDPDGRFDQWMLVGLDAAFERVENPTIVSFIGVQKKDASGRVLPEVRLHFRDYLASAGDAGSWTLELPENFGGKCYACHGSGLRDLIPTRETLAESAPVNGEAGYGDPDVAPDFGFERLKSMNERIRSYGLPDWNGAIDPSEHGPRLGATLGCTECHDGRERGVLTVTTSEGMLWQKIVGQLSMRSPFDDRKVPDERAIALLEREKTAEPPLSFDEVAELERARAEHLSIYEALVAERFPAWRDWALEVGCE